MVFQPTSPIKTFHQAFAGVFPGQHQATTRSSQTMPSNRASNTLERLRLKRRTNKAGTGSVFVANTTAIPKPLPASIRTDSRDETVCEEDSGAMQVLTSSRTVQQAEEDSNREVIKCMNSPTDPAYLPSQAANGGYLRRPPAKPRRRLSTAETQLGNLASQSFFDTSSESEEDEPIIARAQSVRISKPSIVRSSNYQEDNGALCDTNSSLSDHPNSPSDTKTSEVTESTIVDMRSGQSNQKSKGPEEALKALEGIDTTDHESARPIPNTYLPSIFPGGLSEKERRGGLHMHPILNDGEEHLRQVTLSPSLPQRSLTNRRVKIRPADLVVDHAEDNARPFRETFVSTPYPNSDNRDEKVRGEEVEEDEKVTALPQRSNTAKSTRFDSDRFPSPDRPEILSLDLGLAGHPAISTTLEINIADKGIYDDEMLFRQIRQAYRSKLLGASRLPFCLLRTLSHATISPSLQYDFRTKEFMKHLTNPRLGRKRKTWVIWLRHHSYQKPSIQDRGPDSSKRPISASLKTADRRLSLQSDSTSTFNFPFLPWLTLPRIPFLSKEATTTLSASSYHFSPASGLEGGKPAIKLEFHHAFSFWALAFLNLWLVIWSISAVVLWVIFGVPGTRPGIRKAITPTMGLTGGMVWNTAAQTRVLTGLVLGMTVALLGSMVELGLIAGAYILL